MIDSFEEFRTAIQMLLRDKITQRLQDEKEHISNSLLQGKLQQEYEEESRSKEK